MGLEMSTQTSVKKFDLSNIKQDEWWTSDKNVNRYSCRLKMPFPFRWEEQPETISEQISDVMGWINTQNGDTVIASTHSHKIKHILKDMNRSKHAVGKISKMKSECFKGSSAPNGSIIRLDLIWTDKRDPIILDADFVYDPKWDLEKYSKAAPKISQALRDGQKAVVHPPKKAEEEKESGKSWLRHLKHPTMIVIVVGFLVVVATTFHFICCHKTSGAEDAERDIEEGFM